MQQERINELIGRVLDGSADPGERSELSEWAASIPEGEAIPVLEAAWERFQPLDRMPDHRAADILSRILEGKAVSLPAKLIWLRAAAAVLILALGTTTYLALHKNPAPPMVAAHPASRPDVAPPSTTRAILTLSDGTRIALDSAATGELAKEAGADIKKMGDGELAYLPAGENNNSTNILYNTVSLPRGSRPLHLTLADGSIVWLNTASSIRYPVAFTGKTRKVTITGEAYFNIAKDPSRPFTVSREGDGSEIQVLGTEFNINAYPDEGPLTVTLLNGSVRLVTAGNHNLVLKPGQQAHILMDAGSGKQGIQLVSNPDLNETMAWKNGRFIFNRSDLPSILRQLCRWYDLDIEYKEKIIDDYTVSVSRDVPVSRLFQYIELSGGVHFNIEGKKVIVSK